MSFIFLFLCFFSNITHPMNNELSKPIIVSAQQDPKAFSYPSYLHTEDFVQKPMKKLFDSDPTLTDELVESIYQAAPDRVHTIIKSSQANFKSSDSIPSKCLLLGPSGCGKTMLSKVIALKLNCPYKIIEAPLLFDRYKNSAIEKLTDQIDAILACDKKSVVIFDEMNAITDKQEVKNDPDSTTSSAFWLLLDKCIQSKKVFVIGTSNKKASDLPSQFQTRFANNSIITIDFPTTQVRANTIKYYLNREAHECSDSYIKNLAKKTVKKSAREIKDVITEAAQNAAYRDALNVVIKKEDIEKVLKTWPSKWRIAISYEALKPYLHQLPSQGLQLFIFFISHRFQQRVFNWQQENAEEQLNLQREGIRLQQSQLFVATAGKAVAWSYYAYDWIREHTIIGKKIEQARRNIIYYCNCLFGQIGIN